MISQSPQQIDVTLYDKIASEIVKVPEEDKTGKNGNPLSLHVLKMTFENSSLGSLLESIPWDIIK